MPVAVAPGQVWLTWAEVAGILQIPEADAQWFGQHGPIVPKSSPALGESGTIPVPTYTTLKQKGGDTPCAIS